MLKVEDLTVSFGDFKAVSSLSFSLKKGLSLGLIGESGSGKTTVAMALMRLLDKKVMSNKSKAFFEEKDLFALKAKDLKEIRQDLQIVFQDPFSSLNPRMRVGEIVEEGLLIQKKMSKEARKEKALEILSLVGLSENSYERYPHEFSGGQRQRIAIARALILSPRLLIADEPVSALDVSVQAQILNLMKKLKQELGLTYLFISHDLGTVDYFCDEVLVLYLGELMEYGSKELLKNPTHPYTKLLLNSLPGKIYDNQEVQPVDYKSACPFFKRCNERSDICKSYNGSYKKLKNNHLTTCVKAEQ